MTFKANIYVDDNQLFAGKITKLYGFLFLKRISSGGRLQAFVNFDVC
jgi:hypothetical protein